MIFDNDRRNDPSAEVTPHGTPRSNAFTVIKLLAAAALFYSAGLTFAANQHIGARSTSNTVHDIEAFTAANSNNNAYSYINRGVHGRRLSSAAKISKENPPSYMTELLEDLKARTKMMEETPPAEVKYWFEYTGPLQVS